MSLGIRSSFRILMFALALAAAAVLSAPASAQEGNGYVDDWSAHHAVFSNPGSERGALERGKYDEWFKVTNDQRYMMQQLRKAEHGRGHGKNKASIKRDWSMDSGNGVGISTPTVSGIPGSGTVSTSSTLTIDGQTFTGSAPTVGTQTGTFGGSPTSGQTFKIANTRTGNTLTLTASAMGTATITIVARPANGDTISFGSSGEVFCFGNAVNCGGANYLVARPNNTTTDATNLAAAINADVTNVTATSAANIVTVSNTTTSSINLATSDDAAINLNGVVQTSTTIPARSANGCTSSTTGTFQNVTTGNSGLAAALAAAITSCNGSFSSVGVTASSSSATVTFTAVAAGSQSETLTTGLGAAFTLGGTTISGTDGSNSLNSFKYSTSGAYDTAAQLAADLDAAIIQNSTVTGAMTVSYTAGNNYLTLTNKSGTSYAVSTGNFTALSGTGTLAGNAASSTVQASTYPAKYGFSTTDTPSCSDYIVYPTGYAGVAGSAGQATVVGYDNLYKTTCSGSVPAVEWAYNTGAGATAGLSPVISNDGTEMAYIQVSSSVASLVLVKPTAGLSANESATCTLNSTTTISGCPAGFFSSATLGAPITGTGIPAGTYIASGTGTSGTLSQAAAVSASESVTLYAPTLTTPYTLAAQASAVAYSGCTAPCFYAMTLNGSPNDTNSSPYYTYNSGVSDTIFVGDNGGKMHKFTGVFNGTPAEVTTNWPATVSTQTNKVLTSPVYDGGASQLVFVEDSSGYLYSITSGTSPGTTIRSNQLVCGTSGFVDSPIVDSVTEYVYVFVGEGCDATPGNSYVNRFAAGTTINASYGTSISFGNAGTNSAATVQYDGAFDNIYFNGTGNSGNLYTCVNGTVFQIPLSSFGTTIHTFATEATTTGNAATCSPVSEYYNTSGAGVDYLFVSLLANGKTVGVTCASGCVYNFNITSGATPGTPTAALQSTSGTSAVVVDNSGTVTGESQLYYSTLGNQSCVGNGTTGGGTGTCAVQASQSALQ